MSYGVERVPAGFAMMFGAGMLSAPLASLFAGQDEFKGQIFHTARWPKEPIDFTGKLASPLVGNERVADLIELAHQDAVELVERQADAVIGNPVVLVVVRADLFAPSPTADLLTTLVGGPSRPPEFTATTAKYQTPEASVENS